MDFDLIGGILGGGLGVKLIDLWIRRIELRAKREGESEQVAVDISREVIAKLFEQVKLQDIELNQLRTEVDDCQAHHRQCQSEQERLAERLERAMARIELLERKEQASD